MDNNLLQIKKLAISILAGAATLASAAPIQLLKDINPYIYSKWGGSNPAPLGSAWVTALCDSTNSPNPTVTCHPWLTDGTSANTHRISLLNGTSSEPVGFTAMGGAVYFLTNGGIRGLWRTDGTGAGTVELTSSSFSAVGTRPVIVGSALYFVANNDEIWKSDGTAAGTAQFAALAQGSTAAVELASLDGALYALARNGSNRTLWRSDGTAGNLTQVATFAGNAQDLGVFAGRMYFDVGSNELWSSDGTSDGTQLLRSTASTRLALNVVEMGGKAYFIDNESQFSAKGTLWQTDGTPGGSVAVHHFDDAAVSIQLATNGTFLFFSAGPAATGFELWRSDGTDAGTQMVKEVNPGPSSGAAVFPSSVVAGGVVYFQGFNSASAVWRSDGTDAGTFQVASVPGLLPSAALGDKALFQLTGSSAYQQIAFVSDGTAAGTGPLQPVSPEINLPSECDDGGYGLVRSGTLLFLANDGLHGCELWKSDGTAAGTTIVTDINPGARNGIASFRARHDVALVGSDLYFVADDGTHGEELWRSDGTSLGTVLVKDISIGANPTLFDRFAGAGSMLFFAARSLGDATNKLWRSNGTAIGTSIVLDSATGAPVSDVQEIASFGGLAIAIARDATSLAVWSVPQAGNATLLSRISATAPFDVQSRVTASRAYFAIRSSGNGQLWTSDGTSGGTSMLASLGDVLLQGTAGDILIFGAFDDNWRIWRSDGSAGNTYPIASPLFASWGVTMGQYVYFSAANSLYRTDGSSDGTQSLKSFSGSPRELTAAQGTLFFFADDGVHGIELWKSNGTASGTSLVEDFYPAGGFALLGTKPKLRAGLPNGFLFYAATDRGQEPYLLPFATVPQPIDLGSATGVLTNSDVYSSAGLLTGIDIPVAISATNGQFCVSSTSACTCDVASYGTSAMANFGHYLCIKQRSSSAASTTVTTTLFAEDTQIGAFSSTTGSVNPATISFAASNYTVTESGTVAVVVQRSGDATGAVSVAWTSVSGSAVAGTDFGTPGDSSERNGVLNWADGDTSDRMIMVGTSDLPLIDDLVEDPAKAFSISLSTPTGAVLGARATANVNLADDDATISFEVGSTKLSEFGSNSALWVQRSGLIDQTLTVRWSTVDGTAQAGQDFGTPGSPDPVTGVLTFLPGETLKFLSVGSKQALSNGQVVVFDNGGVEPDEQFQIVLSSPSAGVHFGAHSDVLVTIAAHGTSVSLSTASIDVSEHDGSAVILVNRNGALDQAASVTFATIDGTAVVGTHYGAPTGTVSWAAFDATPKAITIPIIDNSASNTPRAFQVVLSSPINTTLGSPSSATVNIIDDDDTVQFSTSSASITEGSGPLVLNVFHGGFGYVPVTVTWTISGNLVPGVDYTGPSSGTLSWAVNDVSTRQITIPIVNDDVARPQRSGVVTLSGPVNAKLGVRPTVNVVINDDDKGFAFEQADYTVAEYAASVTLRVKRQGLATAAATVRWTTANGSAAAGQDFGTRGSALQRGGTLSWVAGDTTAKVIVVPILQDTTYEGPETFTVTLSSASTGMSLMSPAIATVTITDDELPTESAVSFVDPKVVVLENAGNALLAVHRESVGAGFTVPLTVTYATIAGTALAASDFTTRTGTLTWAASDPADKTISVPLVNNAVAESPKSFKVRISTTSPGARIDMPEATVAILDDDEVFPAQGAIPDGWTVPVGAAAGWHVSNDAGAYEGVFSLRSDPINDGEAAQVEVTRNFATGTISFRAKVSSEAGFDALRFYIDDEVKGTWSGTTVAGWQLFSAPITAGTHTLRWSYEKDASASMGQDAAWIDAVAMP